jgi:hypothetical protein
MFAQYAEEPVPHTSCPVPQLWAQPPATQISLPPQTVPPTPAQPPQFNGSVSKFVQ